MLNELENTSVIDQPVGVSFMCVALIDLLSQFFDGSLSKTGSAKRFLLFAQKYLKLTRSDAQALYQYRNAVVHGFGNHSFNKSLKKEFRFYRDVNQNTLFVQKGSSTYGVNPALLKLLVQEAAEHYKNNLLQSAELEERFERVYKRMGRLL